MDKRIKYLIVLDTETANSFSDETGKLDLSNSLVYDIGWQVVDKQGRVYEKKSYIVEDIFFGYSEMMKSAYYAKKIPQYLKEIEEGKRKVERFYKIRLDLLDTLKRYDTKVVSIYDVRMDASLRIKEFKEMTEEWLDFIIDCRNGKSHDYDIVIGAMADDQIYNFVSDYMDGSITREQFWVLAKFKYPTHQIAFCTESALRCLEYRECEVL